MGKYSEIAGEIRDLFSRIKSTKTNIIPATENSKKKYEIVFELYDTYPHHRPFRNKYRVLLSCDDDDLSSIMDGDRLAIIAEAIVDGLASSVYGYEADLFGELKDD